MILDRIRSMWLYHKTKIVGIKKLKKMRHNLDAPLVISLTSYPPRFKTLAATLISLLNQNTQPDSVILWIAHEDRSKLPRNVLQLQDKGLRISYCTDIKSYKKIIPALVEDPKRYIVTADDDVFYGPNWLKELTSHRVDGKVILCHRAHQITFSDTQNILNYNKWKKNSDARFPSVNNFATGIGGIIYPPGCFHSDVTRADLFMEICPTADDVWLFWMTRMHGFKVATVGRPKKFNSWVGSQRVGLHVANTLGSNDGNDKQIAEMIAYYGWPRDE